VLHDIGHWDGIGYLVMECVEGETLAKRLEKFVLPAVVSKADPELERHLMSDLNMLAVTGGRERSEREWKALLESAGFWLNGVYPVGSDVAIVEAKPAQM
jgi:hypothetical protein